jgi:hypothetical protein
VQYKTRISSISSSNNSNSNSNITQRTNRKGLILTCLHSRTVYGLASQQTRLQTKFVSITQSPMFNLCSLPPVFNIWKSTFSPLVLFTCFVWIWKKITIVSYTDLFS